MDAAVRAIMSCSSAIGPSPSGAAPNAGEEVTVTLSGATKRARADAEGRWAVTMPEQPAGGPHTLTARTADAHAERARRAGR